MEKSIYIWLLFSLEETTCLFRLIIRGKGRQEGQKKKKKKKREGGGKKEGRIGGYNEKTNIKLS